jgi:hypothetical protein
MGLFLGAVTGEARKKVTGNSGYYRNLGIKFTADLAELYKAQGLASVPLASRCTKEH